MVKARRSPAPALGEELLAFKVQLGSRISACATKVGGVRQLAGATEISESQIFRYIKGESDATAEKLVSISRAAGVSLDWLAGGEGEMRPATGRGLAGSSGDHAASALEGYVRVPRFVDLEASAGPGAFADTARVVDYLIFREDWVRRALGADPRKLVLVTATGDSMEPAIRSGDLLLVDTGVDRLVDDAIYVVARHGRLMVKRLQSLFNGAVVIRSDNAVYADETLDPADAEQLHVAGRVRWIGRLV